MTAVDPKDEGRHAPDTADQFWNESWYFDFATPDGKVGGYVRVGLYPSLGTTWYWAYLVGEGRPLIALRDHEVPIPKSPAETAVVDRFVSAFQRFDLEELVALLTDDARLTMPPEPADHRGPGPIARFLLQSHQGQELKFLPARANGQPALVLYLPDPSAPIWRACGLIVVTLRGDRVRALTRFADLSLLTRFGYPRTLPRG